MNDTVNLVFSVALGAGASLVTTIASHWLTRWRQISTARDAMKVELYCDIIHWIVDNEELYANRSGDFQTPSVEAQKRRLRIYHQLRLVATNQTLDAYDQYRSLFYVETELPRDQWSDNASAVSVARDQFVDCLRAELRSWRDG